MSQAETRERAAAGPTETDIAFAKAIKSRRTGAAQEVPAPPPEEAVGDDEKAEPSEMAALRAELAQLRSIVMSRQAPTDARRVGEVADAELASEACNADLLMAINEAKPRSTTDHDGTLLFVGEDHDKIQALRAKLAGLNQAVDVARAMAGIIPRTHPGLKRLPPEHPVFRVGR